MSTLQDKTAIRHIERAYVGTKWIAQTRAELAQRFPTTRIITTEATSVSNPSRDLVLVIQINKFGTVQKVYAVEPYSRSSYWPIILGNVAVILFLLLLVYGLYIKQYRQR